MYHTRFCYILVLSTLCLILLHMPAHAHAAGPPQRIFIPLATKVGTPDIGVSEGLTPEEQEIIRLTNEQRTEAGCAPLTVSFQLMTAARNHTRDMAENNFMSHLGSDGSTFVVRYERVGYVWRAAAENVAAGYTTPQEVVEGWMESDGHRKNILNCAISEVGVGYAYSAQSHSTYWTQDFGTPQ